MPTVDLSKINIDKLGLSVEDFNRLVPSAESGANSISSAVQRMGAMALIVAGNFDALGLSVKNALSDKAQKIIDRNNRQIAIRNEKDPKKKRRLEAEDQAINSGFNPTDGDFSAVADSFYNALGAKDGKSGGKSERARDSWLSFYDEIRKKNSSSLGEIELEQARMFQRLEEHHKKGVVTYQEYETAKTAIAERFARQRLELAGKYAPDKMLKANLNDDLRSIQELYSTGQLNQTDATKAKQRAQFDYAQGVSQNAVDPLSQFRAQFDPNQEIENQRTRDLALLDAMQSGNEQKLLSEEEYQKRRQQIMDRYDNQRRQSELDYYGQSAQMMSSAFDTMAGVMENAAGKQSGIYKAMFVASKAFAIAESIIKIQQGIANASSLPFPSNLSAMASVAASTANIVSTIQSVSMKFATGGHVQGPGTGTSDSIPAWLSNNEFVMTSRTVDHYGVGFMNALNQRRLPKFANGGRVGGGGSPSYPGILSNRGGGDMNNDITITIHIDNNGNEETTTEQKAQQGKELSELITGKVVEVLRNERRPGGLLG